MIQVRNTTYQQKLKGWLAQPVDLTITIMLLISVAISLQHILGLAIQHWQKPILFHDSLYLLRGKDDVEIFSWLLKQHNEHRLIISKITSLIEASIGITPGQSSIFQIFIFLIIAMILWWKLCRQILSNGLNIAITTLSGWLILLNPWQYENLTWEFQPPWFVINAVVLAGAVLLSRSDQLSKASRLSRLCRGAAAAALPWIALASSGQGIAFAMAFSVCGWIVNRRMGWIITSSSALALVSNYVLLPYTKPEHHPDIRFQLDFFLQIWLGGKWQGLALMTAIIGSVMLWKRSRTIPQSSWPIIAMPGLFSLLFAGMITLSRSAFGLQQADASRYVTHSLMIGLSALLALACTLDHRRTKPTMVIGGFLVLLSTVGSFPQRFTANGILFGEAWRDARKSARSKQKSFICHSRQAAFKGMGLDLQQRCKDEYENQQLLISHYLSGGTAIAPTGWHRKLMEPPIQIKPVNNNSNQLHYQVESIKRDRDTIKIDGWAFTREQKNKQADRQLFLLASYADRPRLVIAIDQSRPDVQAAWRLRQNKVGFQAVIPTQRAGQPLTSIRLAGQLNNQKIWENQRTSG